MQIIMQKHIDEKGILLALIEKLKANLEQQKTEMEMSKKQYEMVLSGLGKID